MNLYPGDIGFSTNRGAIGIIPNIGQAMLKDACRYTHVFIHIGGGYVLEAMPGGARIVPGADRPGPWFRLPLTNAQKLMIPHNGETLAGTPYSFMNYPALAWHQWKLPGHNLLRGYVSKSKRMICSQLVDHLLMISGYHVFNDGRWPQDVTPGDLFYACMQQGVLLNRVGNSPSADHTL